MPRKKGREQKEHPVRLPDHLWHLVGQLAGEFGYDDARGAHAALIRDMVASAAAEWNLSPYVCRSAQHTVLITDEGDLFYRLVQVLKLNSDRHRLPCSVEIKREKREYFMMACPEGESQIDWVRSRWLFNCFAAWLGPSVEGDLLSVEVDRHGTDSKTADLLINQVRERIVTRELLVAIKDFVQWREDVPAFDRIELPVDIPTRNLRVNVVVDKGLYRHATAAGMYEIPLLKAEFRNRESARFASTEIGHVSDAHIVGVARHLSTEDKAAEEAVRGLQDIGTRLQYFSSQKFSDGPLIEEKESQRLLEAFRFPEELLFYQMDWPSPHLGVEVCVEWEKPVKG
ncbi:MAG: hypothetical protein ACJ76J_18680 [Thermoanaerobaculia bacterium]